ncbi:MAG: TetR/AcrR family transcriptional regulator [Methylophaga sp.]|nr:TetR/AcrR family transcriptional regulator [Methylophaga sp.]
MAKMTHGAFYAHFKSKNDIYAESIRKASEVSKLKQSNVNGVKGAEFVDYIINAYLSKQHLNKEESPCPLAFLATDVADNDMQVKTVYTDTEVFGKLSGLLEQELLRSNDIDNEEVILAVTAMMIGGVAVSRALVDPVLID